MNVTLVKNFNIFFLGMKHALKQVWSKLLTSPTCIALGCTKIVKSFPPSFLLHMHSSSSWTPWHSFEMQSAWAFNTQPPHLSPCYTYPYALMQAFMFQEQVFCSNAYKQALTTKNEKSESSCVNEAFGHKLGTKLIWHWVLVQNRVWHPVQPLCIFFAPSFGFHPLIQPNLGFLCPLSTTLWITLVLYIFWNALCHFFLRYPLGIMGILF